MGLGRQHLLGIFRSFPVGHGVEGHKEERIKDDMNNIGNQEEYGQVSGINRDWQATEHGLINKSICHIRRGEWFDEGHGGTLEELALKLAGAEEAH